MFPEGSAQWFKRRDKVPKELGTDPRTKPGAETQKAAKAANGNGKGPVHTTIAYVVKNNGKTHKVTVAPTQ